MSRGSYWNHIKQFEGTEEARNHGKILRLVRGMAGTYIRTVPLSEGRPAPVSGEQGRKWGIPPISTHAPKIEDLEEAPVLGYGPAIQFHDGVPFKTFMLGDYRYAWCGQHGTIAIIHRGVWSDTVAMLIHRQHDQSQHGGIR